MPRPDGAITQSRSRFAVLLIFLAALLLRITHLAFSRDNPLLYYPVLDEVYYINLGKLIADGNLLAGREAFFMDPLYGYFLGAIFRLFGDNLTVVRLIQILVDSLNTILIFAIGAKIWSRKAGLAGAAIYAVYTVSFFYTLVILKTSFTINLTLLFTLALINVAENNRAGQWLMLGLFAGTLNYLRANLLALAPMAVFFYWIINKPLGKDFVRNALFFTVGLVSLLMIGGYRNYLVSGEFAILNTQSGRLLYTSANPENLTGRYNPPSFSRPNPIDSERDFHVEAEKRSGVKLTKKQVSRFWTMEATKFLVDNSGSIPVILFNKLAGTIGDYEIPTNHSYYLASRFSPITQAPAPSFAFAFSFGSVGLVIAFRRRKETLWLLVPILTTILTVMIFYTSSRLRAPMIPYLLLGAGICLTVFLDTIRDRQTAKTAMILAAVLALFTLSILVPAPKRSGSEEYYLAKAYWSVNNLAQARKTTMKGLAANPGQIRFYNLLGMIDLAGDNLEEAVNNFKKIITIKPNDANAHHNLGLTYTALGRPMDAIGEYRTALSIEPKTGTWFAMGLVYEKLADRDQAVTSYKTILKIARPEDPIRKRAIGKLKTLGLDR